MPTGLSWGSGRFHDAEVDSLRLDRFGPNLLLDLTINPRTLDATSLSLNFLDVGDVDLSGFNGQTALFDIYVTDLGERGWEVEFSSSYGVAGGFRSAALPPLPSDT